MKTDAKTTYAPISVTIEQMAKAFEAWENYFRADMSRYMTTEECAASNVSRLSADRAAYFMEILVINSQHPS
jgi:hypothetical protein